MNKNIVITAISGGCCVFLFLLFLLFLAGAFPIAILFSAIPGGLFFVVTLIFVRHGLLVMCKLLKKQQEDWKAVLNENVEQTLKQQEASFREERRLYSETQEQTLVGIRGVVENGISESNGFLTALQNQMKEAAVNSAATIEQTLKQQEASFREDRRLYSETQEQTLVGIRGVVENGISESNGFLTALQNKITETSKNFTATIEQALQQLDVNSREALNLNETAEYIQKFSTEFQKAAKNTKAEIDAMKSEIEAITSLRNNQIAKLEKLFNG
jgi:hypothetical protein